MNIKLHYIEKGSGKPLVMIHGNGESSAYFNNQISYFSKSYHVIAVDTRGHGKTPRGTLEFTLEQFAEDLKGFLDEKNLNKITILGFSDGANIALIFALKYPQYLEKLILNGADLHPRGVKRTYQIPIIIRYWAISIVSIFLKNTIPRKEMLGLMVNQPNILLSEIEKIEIPTLVIAGTNDMIKKEHTKMISKHIKNSKLSFIKGNHFVAKMNSDEFNKVVENFLNSESN